MTKRPKPPAPSPAAPGALQPLVDAVRLRRASKIETVAEASIICAAIELGEPTVNGLVKHLKMPFSTVSRVAWSLHERGFLEYAEHPTDRRKKLVRAIPGALTAAA